MHETILGEENITKLFFRYTIPSVVAMAILGLNTIVDGFFVGRYIGAAALACVNIALPFSSLILAISIMVGIGTLTLMGRLFGEGRGADAQNAFKTALLLILVISGATSCAALLGSRQLAVLLGATPELMADVSSYIRIIAAFLPFLGLVMLLDYVLKIIGKPVYAMLALLVAVAGHMALNYCFIARLGWGIEGAAWATGLAYVIATLVALLPFSFAKLNLKLWGGHFDRAAAKEILYNGSSEGFGELGVGITTFLFNLALMRYAGPLGVAAFTAVGYLSMVGTNLLLGIADGVSSIISYNQGRGRIDRVMRTLKLSLATVLLVGTGMFALLQLAAPRLIALFFDVAQGETYTLAVAGAKIYAFAFLLNGSNILASGYFTAIGSPKQATLIALSRSAVWVAAGLAILAPLFGSKGIWLAVPTAEAMTLLLSTLLLRRQWTKGKLMLT